MAVAKREKREKPVKIEQRKGPKIRVRTSSKTNSPLDIPISGGGEKNTQKRGAKIEPGVSLLFASFGSACPHVWRMYFPFLANKTEL